MSRLSINVLGERDANRLVHPHVHRGVHLGSEPNCRNAMRMHMMRRVILYVAKALNRAGATPLLTAFSRPRFVGSLPPVTEEA
jgi:hypothetical protein